MRKFGLIGKKLTHSFSPSYFNKKFALEAINASYQTYELDNITLFPNLLQQEHQLVGLNVTIPYKQDIIPYLDDLDSAAKCIGAVNCIKIKNGATTGYNTDWIGFSESLQPILQGNIKYKALLFGDGGAAQAIKYALAQLQIPYLTVTRNNQGLNYNDVDQKLADDYLLWINTTPVGMFPNINEKLPIPLVKLSSNHILYDLIYNPSCTTFMQIDDQNKPIRKNGLEMLHLQAEAGWKIWNSGL